MGINEIIAVYEKTETGYGIFLPCYDGLTGFGKTLDSAKVELKECLFEYINYCKENDILIDEPLDSENLTFIYISDHCYEELITKGSKGKIEIILDEYYFNDDYGTNVFVNNIKMPFINQDAQTILKEILSHLKYESVIISKTNGEITNIL